MEKKDKKKNLKTENKSIKKEKNKEKKEKKAKLSKEEKAELKGTFSERFALGLRKRLLTNGIQTYVLVLFLVLAFIAINIWAQSKDLAQIDVTENKLYSLTDTSKNQLSNLNKEVNIYIYGLEEGSAYVTFIKQYAAFNSNIKYEIVTAETNYEIISRYSLSKSDGNAIVVVCGDKDVTLHPDYEFSTYDYVNGVYEDVDLTEECITNAIINVSSDDPVKVYLASGHGEYSLNELSGLSSLLEAQVYEVEELNLLSVNEIPEDCDILAVLDPTTDITENEANALKQYVNRGGNMFFAMRKADSSINFANLQTVLDLYGAKIEYGVLYEGNSSNALSTNGSSYPFVILPNASTSSDVSKDLSESNYTTVLPWAQQVVINDVKEENVEVTNQELLYTSSRCYSLTDISQGFITDGQDQNKYTVASKLTRTVTTPAPEEGGESSSVSSNMIIIGNASFVADYDQIGILQSPISFVGNANFALNCFADLAEQDNLITARKSSNVTTFTSTTMEDLIVKTIIFGVPVLIILIGIIIWNIRRRKR